MDLILDSGSARTLQPGDLLSFNFMELEGTRSSFLCNFYQSATPESHLLLSRLYKLSIVYMAESLSSWS